MEELIYRDRRGTNCSKWNKLSFKFTRDDLMGLWVADMDFTSPQSVRDALHQYAEYGVFGYDMVPDSYFQAFIDWERMHHGYEVKQEWLCYAPGVVAAFNWLVQLNTQPGDSVLVQTPVYYPFFGAVLDHGRKLVESELVNTGGVYTIDFDDFEKKITENNVKAFILCSPHNPVGRVWKREELETMLAICRRHHVFVIADEIHHDFVNKGHQHIPAATVGDYDDMLVTITAPSKTFNLAGLKNSIVIIPDEGQRSRYQDYARKLHADGPNSAGVVAAQAAYTGGAEWLTKLLERIYGNYDYLRAYLQEHLPKAVVSPLEGTYLAWLDFGAYLKPEEMEEYIEGKCGLAMDYGPWFGGASACHVRMNLATSLENIQKAAQALAENMPQ